MLRERLLESWDVQSEPIDESGFELAGVRLGQGEVADWLAAHTSEGRTGVTVQGRWGSGTGEVWSLAFAAADGTGAWVDAGEVSPEDDAALMTWFATRPAPRCCTTRRARCWPWRRAVGRCGGWSATPRCGLPRPARPAVLRPGRPDPALPQARAQAGRDRQSAGRPGEGRAGGRRGRARRRPRRAGRRRASGADGAGSRGRPPARPPASSTNSWAGSPPRPARWPAWSPRPSAAASPRRWTPCRPTAAMRRPWPPRSATTWTPRSTASAPAFWGGRDAEAPAWPKGATPLAALVKAPPLWPPAWPSPPWSTAPTASGCRPACRPAAAWSRRKATSGAGTASPPAPRRPSPPPSAWSRRPAWPRSKPRSRS